MKGYKQNIIKIFLNWLNKKYSAPEDCKLQMAERNLNTMIRVQPILIALGIYGYTLLFIKFKGNYIDAIPRFIYFGEYIVLGILCILLSLKLRKR